MHKTRGWTGLRTAVITLGMIAATATSVRADALLTYSTSGSIDTTTGISGAPVISFNSLKDVTVDATSNTPIGSFQVAALAQGQTTTYNDTPFKITFLPYSYNGITLSDSMPLTITGTLTGKVSSSFQSSVEATFNPIAGGAITLAGASSTLSFPETQKLLVPSSAGGITTVEGVINTVGSTPEVPAPEPSTIALFLSTVGGLGLRRFVLSRRQPKPA